MFGYQLVIAVPLLLLSIFTPSHAVESPSVFEKSEIISIDSNNLSAEAFWRSYTSSVQTDKYAARHYLLGVMDATEGKTWCSYQQFKTISLRDYLNGYFSKLTKSQLQQRASSVIEVALIELSACKGNL
ncbi:hypothetical protein MN202_03030 [Rheinheimera muenzenbergensis]|uniref:Rap1a immunity protein domain-containing protein n=1 Tax=Rheinheimera muenzenbergensis TaxID=1193628 RepID=A0ABU8C2T0_9GAMM